MCGAKREKVSGRWRKLHNEELQNLYTSIKLSFTAVIKSTIGPGKNKSPTFLEATRATLKTTRPTVLLLLRIRYRGKLSTEPLLNNDRGIFTEPLPSNDEGNFTESLPSNDTGYRNTHTHTQSKLIS
jgi:hypothetical protein